MKIENIKNPRFIKDLSNEQLKALASEMREFILQNVSTTGGHLSSNLGVVELTIALAKVFDFSKDAILFDVGHQCYAYKILTGRAKDFSSLRKLNGISGFQSIKESKYDKFEAGHSSTSVGTGMGMAIARDLNNQNFEVISVIGDGSIGNGLVYEALNQIGDLQNKQIIILNDNQMSISQNVGAIHNALDEIRSSKGYNQVKKNTKRVLNKTKIGNILYKFTHKIKTGLKKIYLHKAKIFSDFNIQYYGPIHGHDFKELIKYLEIAKNQTSPVILHVITQKGKGYSYAENDKNGKYHGIGPFNLETGELKKINNLPSYSEVISSFVYNYAKKDKDIICITPAMGYGSKLNIIAEKLPKQYIDVGIAEEHALLVANGLALQNKKPIIFIYSSFLQRGYDQIIHDIARMDNHVIFCIDRSGIVPEDGISHQGLFDIPMLSSVPNMVITSPSSAYEANCLINTALNANKPFAIRYPKINLKYDYGKPEILKIGSWEVLNEGEDATIITYGDFVSKAININDKFANIRKSLTIVNARFIKPFDVDLFKQIIKTNKPIFIYEESMINGSLGSILSIEIQKYNTQSKIYIFGIDDAFLTHGTRDELLALEQLDENSVYNKIKDLI